MISISHLFLHHLYGTTGVRSSIEQKSYEKLVIMQSQLKCMGWYSKL